MPTTAYRRIVFAYLLTVGPWSAVRALQYMRANPNEK